jgi:hypothetical protein
MNGDEVGVDCGGPVCSPCPCTESKLLLQQNSYQTEFHRNTSDWVRLRNDVELEAGSHAAFSAMNFVELSPTFEVKQGSEALFTIDNCVGLSEQNIIDPALLSENEDCGTLFPEASIIGTPCAGTNSPVTIRVYLHIIHEDDGSGGLASQDVATVKANMNQTYNKHGIMFNFCERHINFSAALIDARQIPELLYPFASLPDGINGYLVPLSTPSGDYNGVAEDIPSANFWSKNSYGTASHEIGHCLNLLHTRMNYFRIGINNCLSNECIQERVMRPEDCAGSCPQFDCENQTCAPNCYEAGDMVCDTPPDPYLCSPSSTGFSLSPEGILNYSNWTDACNEEYIGNDVIPTNVMSYWRRDIQITDEQACRVHNHISTDGSFSITTSSQSCPVNSSSCSAITFGTSVWTTNQQFDRNVIINGDLTIDGAIVSFARGTSLTVNGDLTIINNSFVGRNNLNPCNPTNNVFWIGIKLHHLAYVEIHNSFIEFSQLGVSIAVDPLPNDNLPWINMDNVTFLNNFSSVRKSNSSGTLRLTDCAFIVTTSYPYNAFGSQLLVASAKGTNFLTRCSFEYNGQSYNGNAINTYESQLTVDASNFEGWFCGISATSMNLNGLSSNNNTFTNNITGIALEDGIFVLKNNEFNFHQQTNDINPMTAVEIENVNNFTIEDNLFTEHSQQTRRSFGLKITDSEPYSLEVQNNEFINLTKNIETFGDNGDMFQGIQFSCNTSRGLNNHPSGSGEFIINGSISPLQGSSSIPTGNIFEHDCYSTVTDFDYRGSQFIDYYYLSSDIAQRPICFDGLSLQPVINNNNNCSILNRLTETNKKSFKEMVENLNLKIYNLNSDLNNLLDGGQTNTLLKQIRQGTNESILNKIKDMENLRNLVSADVIRELLNSSDGLLPHSFSLSLKTPQFLETLQSLIV